MNDLDNWVAALSFIVRDIWSQFNDDNADDADDDDEDNDDNDYSAVCADFAIVCGANWGGELMQFQFQL